MRKRGYVIHGQRRLAAITGYISMTYALHRDLRAAEQMPNPFWETKAWVEKKSIRCCRISQKFVDLNSEAVDSTDIFFTFIAMFEKHAKRSALALRNLPCVD
ncbi:hypothetical protein ACFS07_06655 [Undibacterium arcticum]